MEKVTLEGRLYEAKFEGERIVDHRHYDERNANVISVYNYRGKVIIRNKYSKESDINFRFETPHHSDIDEIYDYKTKKGVHTTKYIKSLRTSALSILFAGCAGSLSGMCTCKDSIEIGDNENLLADVIDKYLRLILEEYKEQPRDSNYVMKIVGIPIGRLLLK